MKDVRGLSRSKYNKAYYHSHKKECAEYQARYFQKVKQEVVDLYGGRCDTCRETDLIVLELHHIDHDGSEERKEIGMGPSMYRHARKKYNPLKYQILCANCHRRAHSTKSLL